MRSRKKAKAPELSVRQYLQSFPPAVRRLTNDARRLIRLLVPGILERVYPGWKLIGLRIRDGRRLRYMGYLSPTTNHVVLGFEYGKLMADPYGILQGAGSQVRSIEIRSREDLRQERVAPYILEAVQITLETKSR